MISFRNYFLGIPSYRYLLKQLEINVHSTYVVSADRIHEQIFFYYGVIGKLFFTSNCRDDHAEIIIEYTEVMSSSV